MSRRSVSYETPSIQTWLRRAVQPTGNSPLRYLGRLAEGIAEINLSIRAKILVSLGVVILIMGLTNVLLVLQVLDYSRQYNAIITNITTANSISGNIKPDIDTEMWMIVAGKVDFKDGRQYEMIDGVNAQLASMIANSDSPQRQASSWRASGGRC